MCIEINNDSDEDPIALVIFEVITVVQTFICVLFYLRVFPSMGFYVKMVADGLQDMKPFSIFYLLWTLFFTCLYVGLDLDVQFSLEDMKEQ